MLLIELFGGIGGGRRALELLQLEVAGHMSVEMNPEAQRVVIRARPAVAHYEDVKHFGKAQLMEARRKLMRIEVIVFTNGAPCQDVSGLNATRKGISGSRSRLIEEVPRVVKEAKLAFPEAEILALGENVASMLAKDEEEYNALLGTKAIEFCPSSFCW